LDCKEEIIVKRIMDENIGFVYLFTNPAMPGLVKIGITGRNADTRMSELYTVGVPVPFECAYAAQVREMDKVEKALHNAFSPQRINPRREFFQIEVEQAIGIIKLLEIKEITTDVTKEAETIGLAERQAGEALRKKRPNQNFVQMGIPLNSVIYSTKTQETATITGEKTVRFREEDMSLTRATRILLELDYSVQPGPYWTFNGKTLREIYNDTYQVPD
jgi:hypothetical protein